MGVGWGEEGTGGGGSVGHCVLEVQSICTSFSMQSPTWEWDVGEGGGGNLGWGWGEHSPPPPSPLPCGRVHGRGNV